MASGENKVSQATAQQSDVAHCREWGTERAPSWAKASLEAWQIFVREDTRAEEPEGLACNRVREGLGVLWTRGKETLAVYQPLLAVLDP